MKTASLWWQFSSYIPQLLLKMKKKAKKKEVKDHFDNFYQEELTYKHAFYPHGELFLHSLNIVHITPFPKNHLLYSIGEKNLLFLSDEIDKSTTDSYLIGLHFGLERYAYENLELLLNHLSNHQDKIRQQLMKTPFFKEHLNNEKNHIQSCLTLKQRFCTRGEDYIQEQMGENHSYHFWRNFWREINHESARIFHP